MLRISSNLLKISSINTLSKSLSTNVTAQLVKELREKSGAPMMDCKKALGAPEVAGDIEKAMAWLRAKGIARAVNSDRVSLEGLIAVYSKDNKTTLLEINSETGKSIAIKIMTFLF